MRSDLVDERCDQELGTPAVVAGFLAAAPLAEERWQIELTDGPGHAPWQVATIAKEVGFEYEALLSYLQAREPQRWLSGLASATSELLGANGVHLGDTERMELPMRLAAAAAFLDNVAG